MFSPSRFPSLQIISRLVERHVILEQPYRCLIAQNGRVLCIGEIGCILFETIDEYRHGLSDWHRVESMKSISFSLDNEHAQEKLIKGFFRPNGYVRHFSLIYESLGSDEMEWENFVRFLLLVADEEAIATVAVSPESRECYIYHPLRQRLFFHDHTGRLDDLGEVAESLSWSQLMISHALDDRHLDESVTQLYAREILRPIDQQSVSVIPQESVISWMKTKGFLMPTGMPRLIS